MKKIKEILDNDKTGKQVLVLQIIGVFVLTLGFTLALNYISKSINASLTTANINVIYVGDSNITKDLFLPIKENEIEEYGAVANFTVKGAENNVTDNNIVYDITLILAETKDVFIFLEIYLSAKVKPKDNTKTLTISKSHNLFLSFFKLIKYSFII